MNIREKFRRGVSSSTYRNSRMNQCQNQSYVTTDAQSVRLSWCQAPSGDQENSFVSVRQLRVCICRALSLTRGRVCHLQLLLVLASTTILSSESRVTDGQILLPQIRDSPRPGETSPVFMSPSDRVTQLYTPDTGFYSRLLL
jgi:hypothetical protein